jgi:hypothetical protein
MMYDVNVRQYRYIGIFAFVVLFAGAIALYFIKTGSGPQLEWKNFIFNGDALHFRYPSEWCFDDADCRNLYVTKQEKVFSLGLMQKEQSGSNGEFIDSILDISYVDSVDMKQAETYLKDAYALHTDIQWTTDLNNPIVKIVHLSKEKVYAAFSEELHTLVAFRLQPACLLDCKIDVEILNSITIDGVKVYRD